MTEGLPLPPLVSRTGRPILFGMSDIPPPPPPDDENRHLLCQMAVELPLQDLIEEAVQAGWDETEVLAAIIEVADNLMLANVNNAELDALLRAMKRKLE